MDVVIVYQKPKNKQLKASRDVVAVCSSKRAAITMIVNELLEKKLIETREIANYRRELNEKDQTTDLGENYYLKETTINTFTKWI